MIFKSYLVEKNIEILKNKLVLFYGENFGLIKDFKEMIKKTEHKKKVLRFFQEDILKDQNVIFDEIKNTSLFEEEKIIFIESASDKILKIVEEIKPEIEKEKIYLFSNVLEKKSKLRTYFEKDKDCDIIPCYNDNEISLKNLITKKLLGFSFDNQTISILLENCGFDRMKLNNEIDKIKAYFSDKKIKNIELEKLLNQESSEEFDKLKDSALRGDKKLTNKLLSTTVLELERFSLYVSILNQRFSKLKEIKEKSEENNISQTLDAIKPPIFWKDKPNFLIQAKLWSLNKIRKALKKTYELEITIKSNANINKNLLFKKLILDICRLATV